MSLFTSMGLNRSELRKEFIQPPTDIWVLCCCCCYHLSSLQVTVICVKTSKMSNKLFCQRSVNESLNLTCKLESVKIFLIKEYHWVLVGQWVSYTCKIGKMNMVILKYIFLVHDTGFLIFLRFCMNFSENIFSKSTI